MRGHPPGSAGPRGPEDGPRARRRSRDLLRALLGVVIYPALVFGGAGTLFWVEGWVFLVLLFAFAAGLIRALRRHDPGLLRERARPVRGAGVRRWDRLWYLGFATLYLLWLPLCGLDAVRFGWSGVPPWLRIAGGVAYAASLALLFVVFRANTFLSPVVRIQAERGHTLVDTGPYAVVRHPMYSAVALLLLGASLLLGSLWGTGVAVLLTLLLALRVRGEERALRAELEGYADYVRRVRRRMVPGIW